MSERIHTLSREVIEFQRAVEPLEAFFVDLRERLKETASESELELRRALRDVADHATRVLERIDGFRQLLPHNFDARCHTSAERVDRAAAGPNRVFICTFPFSGPSATYARSSCGTRPFAE